MALYDDKYWLLSHIRNSFITSDDTGMCEIVMSGEDVSKLKAQYDKYPDQEVSDDSEDGLSSESGDLSFGMDFGMRARTNTAARIEKIEQAKKKAALVKSVTWNRKFDEGDTELFVKVDPRENVVIMKKSLLSKKLEECTNLPKNPFMEYAKFEGVPQSSIPTRKYKIFLTMLEADYKTSPLDICCIATARIHDLIGLILFHVRNRHADLDLKPPNHYGLYITEEDGEVYRDLPPLDLKESVVKFGFTCLGLVLHDRPPDEDDNGKNQSTETMIKKKNKEALKEEVKISTDLEAMAVHKKAMEAPLYRSYQINIITKMRSRVEIHLGVSGDKIEIDPIQPQSSKFSLTKQKPVSCHMDSVAWCEITDTKSNKSTFRVFYSNNYATGPNPQADKNIGMMSSLQTSASFKHFDFEADPEQAKEIVEKINLILELKTSQSHKEYLAARERKLFKRKSFNIAK